MNQFKPETPLLTVDIIIELIDRESSPSVLIKRKNPPHGWALPGGFVDKGETIASAARREAMEETCLDVTLTELLGIYSSPERDPRGHSVSAVYIANASGNPSAADDASDIIICNASDAPTPITFDHKLILEDYQRYKRKGIRVPLER